MELIRRAEMKATGADVHDVRNAVRRYRTCAEVAMLGPDEEREFCLGVAVKYEGLLRRFVAGVIEGRELK